MRPCWQLLTGPQLVIFPPMTTEAVESATCQLYFYIAEFVDRWHLSADRR
jgi:hypothetical protein